MVRRGAIALAGQLAVLWVVGLSVEATVWLTWVVGACALLSLGGAKLARADAPLIAAAAPTGAVGALLGGCAIVAFATGASPWLVGWALFSALALCGLAAAGLVLPSLRAFLRA